MRKGIWVHSCRCADKAHGNLMVGTWRWEKRDEARRQTAATLPHPALADASATTVFLLRRSLAKATSALVPKHERLPFGQSVALLKLVSAAMVRFLQLSRFWHSAKPIVRCMVLRQCQSTPRTQKAAAIRPDGAGNQQPIALPSSSHAMAVSPGILITSACSGANLRRGSCIGA